MDGIELSHRKRATPAQSSPSANHSSTDYETGSYLPTASADWAEGASLGEPMFIPSIDSSSSQFRSHTHTLSSTSTGTTGTLASVNPYEKLNGSNSDGMTESTKEEQDENNNNDDGTRKSLSFTQLTAIDRQNFLALVFLYLLQGIPVGLAFGSIPFLLKSRLSYGQVGIFTLASYPYSLKLLWSPIVDAFYSPKFGRRKSWIVPIQTVSALVLIYLSTTVENLLENAQENLFKITMSFFTLVFLCATQDIAVDGWALTLLSQEALSYASTAQTVGLNTGYFMSFTVFLAFNSPDFANKYLRAASSDVPPISLSQYLAAWGWIYLVATALVAILKREERTHADSGGISAVYRSMYKVLRLPNIQVLILVHLVAKIGFQANEAVTNLKLLERGLSKEDLALTVLIDFPFEIIFGYYAAKWSTGARPLRPWMLGYLGRLACAVLSMFAVAAFPRSGKVGPGYLLVIILTHVLGSFMSTIQFVSINAFHTQIADPAIGGTYMTTLNTISNLGGQWPRLIVLYAVDWLTSATCQPPSETSLSENATTPFTPFSCVKEADKAICRSLQGACEIKTDGYYVANVLCVGIGLVLFFAWIKGKMTRLQSLNTAAWRVESPSY
ncbi:uncharacterized protein SAPINGB_P003942 [Magnusiomyces paraingens]|uniref:Major facilitator superfamily (MFS) profile domain-containing protein n=1 Tax=Magnusiomyces paraingens TaxID=2606893 RepID=A0A5E8BT10_9ASCO|nr:uncharacterized protein SAPINGB_P003942 [Saprochaete ingens]VVT54171.1 unnamed protein product [Saprochaete ingens]